MHNTFKLKLLKLLTVSCERCLAFLKASVLPKSFVTLLPSFAGRPLNRLPGRLPFDAGSESYHCERHGHCLLDASSLGPFLENIGGCSRGSRLSSLRWVVEFECR